MSPPSKLLCNQSKCGMMVAEANDDPTQSKGSQGHDQRQSLSYDDRLCSAAPFEPSVPTAVQHRRHPHRRAIFGYQRLGGGQLLGDVDLFAVVLLYRHGARRGHRHLPLLRRARQRPSQQSHSHQRGVRVGVGCVFDLDRRVAYPHFPQMDEHRSRRIARGDRVFPLLFLGLFGDGDVQHPALGHERLGGQSTSLVLPHFQFGAQYRLGRAVRGRVPLGGVVGGGRHRHQPRGERGAVFDPPLPQRAVVHPLHQKTPL